MKYYIICGEASGDLHGSNLVKGLIAADGYCEFRYIGGDLMAEACGALGVMFRHYKDSAVMGIVEVAAKIGTIARKMHQCCQDIVQWQPDVVILIDYPGFNLKIARFAKRSGFKVFYYIPPKLWARGERRIKQIKKYVDKLYVIFPFEINYFKKLGVKALYFGNPLIDSISQYDYHTVADAAKPSIALLAGSRQNEIAFLMPRYVELERLLREDPKWDGYQLILAAAPSVDVETYMSFLPKDSNIKIIKGDTYSVIKQSVASITCSGTATLETALIGTPQVVCYGFHTFTYVIVKFMVNIKYMALTNLILKRKIVQELLQQDASPQNMLKELDSLVFNEGYRNNMISDYHKLFNALGGEGASERVAVSMVNELNRLF